MTDRTWLARRLRRQRAELRQRNREIGHRAAEVRWLKAGVRRLGKELLLEHEAARKRKATNRALGSELLHKWIAEFLRTQTFSKEEEAVAAARAKFDVSRSTVFEIIAAMKDGRI